MSKFTVIRRNDRKMQQSPELELPPENLPSRKIIIIKKNDEAKQTPPIIEVTKQYNKNTVVRQLLTEYLEHLYLYAKEFESYVNLKLFGKDETTFEPPKHIFFNKQKKDYYLNICTTIGEPSGYCNKVGKRDFAHVSFHVGVMHLPFQIHIKQDNNHIILELKCENDNFFFEMGSKYDAKNENLKNAFKEHHQKFISTQNIMGLVNGLFADYQTNKDLKGGCYCVKCLNNDEHVVIDFNNKFFTDFMDIVLEYVKIIIDIPKLPQNISQLNVSHIDSAILNANYVDSKQPVTGSNNLMNNKKPIDGINLMENKLKNQSGGKYIKYNDKYVMLKQMKN